VWTRTLSQVPFTFFLKTLLFLRRILFKSRFLGLKIHLTSRQLPSSAATVLFQTLQVGALVLISNRTDWTRPVTNLLRSSRYIRGCFSTSNYA
ncbi:Uncharacterized protein TCM_037471 isoform 2, partial [Theobroma cacao]